MSCRLAVAHTAGVMLLAIGWTELGAFVALGLATALIVTHVIGLATWLRRRRGDSDTYLGL